VAGTSNSVGTTVEEPSSTIRGSLKSFGAVFAPATLVGALLLYVGWVRTRAFFTYFGIDAIMSGFSPQDYILRSADVGLGAVVLLALAGGALLVVDRIVMNLLRRWRGQRRARLIQAGTAFTGCVLVLVGLYSITARASFAALPPLPGAGFVAAGAVLLLRFGAGGSGRPAFLGPGTVSFGLAVIAVTSFWAAHSYAQDFGVAAAEAVDADSSRFTVMTILSTEPIDIPGSLVVASRVPSADGKWSYRYTGPRLLTYGNERWFLIVTPRQRGYRSTIFTLRDTESVRVETATPASG
jgi:hypothetical protein